MRRSTAEIVDLVAAVLDRFGHSRLAARTAADAAWLEAAGYSGLRLLKEALGDPIQEGKLEKDGLGLDLQGISCVFIAEMVHDKVKAHGRLFLRNVRHGLYLLPGSVANNYGIGCPVDPAFALGGVRDKNPYAERIAAAERDGVEVDEALWQSLCGLDPKSIH